MDGDKTIGWNIGWWRLAGAAAAFRRSGVLAPLIVIDICVALPALILGIWAGPLYQIYLMVVVGVLLGVTLLVYVGFAIFNPDRLHSEHYQIARQGYGLLGDERLPTRAIQNLISSVPAIMNPAGLHVTDAAEGHGD
jgi:hypothetical protein